MKLENKVAIITGSSRGIGRSIAKEFAENGAKVVIVYNSTLEAAKSLEKEIASLGGKSMIVRANISKPEEIRSLIRKVIDKFKKIDILVANAGIVSTPCSIDKATEESVQEVVDTNLVGTYWTIKLIGERLQKSGKIITISSVDGIIGEPFAAMYSATKAGIISLTKSFARHFAKNNIRVNCIAPGLIETDLIKDADKKLIDETLKGALIRRVGQPIEIAKAALFLASEDASYITGNIIPVDGGFHLK